MLNYLFEYLDKLNFPGAGVFTYVTFRAITALVLSIIISTWFGKSFIGFLSSGLRRTWWAAASATC